MGVDRVGGAERIHQGRFGIHGHGYAEGFGDFLLCGAGFEGCVSVEGDAAIAAGGYGYGKRDELAHLLPKERILGVGGR